MPLFSVFFCALCPLPTPCEDHPWDDLASEDHPWDDLASEDHLWDDLASEDHP